MQGICWSSQYLLSPESSLRQGRELKCSVLAFSCKVCIKLLCDFSFGLIDQTENQIRTSQGYYRMLLVYQQLEAAYMLDSMKVLLKRVPNLISRKQKMKIYGIYEIHNDIPTREFINHKIWIRLSVISCKLSASR